MCLLGFEWSWSYIIIGHFAVNKVTVGKSHSYLLKILREVQLLERLNHPNIITYQYVGPFLLPYTLHQI